MAHERTEIELGPGVNALTGPNNSGKSAVVEALRCVATNPVPKFYIRHGATEARVTVELDNATQVTWIRKKRSSGYEVWQPGMGEPQEYWKFGRKPPEDVLKALRLDLVELENGGEIDVHVGNQREPIFLLNQPGSNAAAFFAASTESAHLLAMQNLLKRKTLDARREKKGLEQRLEDVEERLDRFIALPDIGVSLETAHELESSANQLSAEIPKLETAISTQVRLEAVRKTKSASATILNEVAEPPKLHEINRLSAAIDQLRATTLVRKTATGVRTVLGGLEVVPATENTGALADLHNRLQEVGDACDKVRRDTSVLDSLVPPPECAPTTGLSRIINDYCAIRSRLHREKGKHGVLDRLTDLPALESLDRLEAVVADMHRLAARSSEVEASLAELENKLRSLEETVSERVSELGHCPTCGADMNGIAFLDRRHRHDS